MIISQGGGTGSVHGAVQEAVNMANVYGFTRREYRELVVWGWQALNNALLARRWLWRL